MQKRPNPDPRTDILAIRRVARHAACLLPKGVGERVVLREAARMFERACPGLPRALLRGGKALVQAEILARQPVPVPASRPAASPPRALLAALAAPCQPGDTDSAPAAPGQAGAVPMRPEARPPRMPPRGGHLRVIQGGGR
ncbi:MAG TPA: hypothetical protein VE033_06210 [Acetobacteraceae bacterium]|jgi:hypothetical protein|nr:hypothetical protein [Acetobacteraceae bacterium]